MDVGRKEGATVSVIIPAYNEERALPATLASLLRQSGEFEVILVDGGSTDHTVTVAAEFPAVRVVGASKGRASQMNAGARHATGEWLLFLHADTSLPEGGVEQIQALESIPDVQAGGFLHRFTGRDWRLRLISRLDNLRCRRTKIIYGDQALFVRRGLFERLGGFPEQPILEDVVFCERLTQHTTPVLLSPPVLTDSRKFVKAGVWLSLARVLLIILHVQFRLARLPRAFFDEVR